jgi:hypothetical protein
MPSSIIRNPAGPEDDDFKAQQKLEFDRWRTAIEIVRRREAGISCELSNDLKTASDATVSSTLALHAARRGQRMKNALAARRSSV